MFDSNNRIEVNKCINFRGWKKGENRAKSHIYFSGSSRRAVLQLQSFSFCAQKCWSVKFLTGDTYSAYELVIRSLHAYQTFQNGIVAMKRNWKPIPRINVSYIIESDWQPPACSLVSLFKFAGFEQYICAVQRMIENKKNYSDLPWEW